MAERAKRLLLVDDDADGREALGLLLETWGFEVCEACDEAGALAGFRANRPDIVLADIRMPGVDGSDLDGCAVIQHIRTAIGNDVLIIVFSGWSVEVAALAAGADAFVLKPNVDALERLLGRDGLRGVTSRKRRHGA